ncbi:unnamed protein product [Schistosoma intercalatum]|nr:unnamed protein product [Schistosoma intercalatum]
MFNIFESNKDNTTEDGRLLYNFFSLLYIFGGAVPYIPQYLKIRKTQSIKGFSSFVCFILLISNVLRILFWFVQPFSTALLFQSFIMIATMLILLRAITQLSSIKRSPSMPCTISIRKVETETWNIDQFQVDGGYGYTRKTSRSSHRHRYAWWSKRDEELGAGAISG